jgi:hypothetical protein
MLFDIDIQIPKVRPRDPDDERHRDEPVAPLVGPLPADFVLSQHAAALLRRYLAHHELIGYQIFHCDELDLEDVERYLQTLGEDEAKWELVQASSPVTEPLGTLTHTERGAAIWPAGVLRLARYDVVVARWYWADEYDNHRELYLCATPSAAHYVKLRDAVRRCRRDAAARTWQIVSSPYGEPERLPRGIQPQDDLVLSPEIQQRIEMDVVRFFSDGVAELYRQLKVPYRRGVLLHGPPGNGKTSLIRMIGAALPQLPMLIMRPGGRSDASTLQRIISRWSQQAPAVLIIEDLDWLLKETNVSTFLNTLDGIDASIAHATGGLLLIATTNHPEKLDPAINNRPGRFDVVIEMPNPDEALRARFFETKLPEIEEADRCRAVELTPRLSFAHLQEILRLSGLLAIHAGRTTRLREDLFRATEMVRAADEAAANGFAGKPDVPFGLVPRRQK